VTIYKVIDKYEIGYEYAYIDVAIFRTIDDAEAFNTRCGNRYEIHLDYVYEDLEEAINDVPEDMLRE